MINTGQKEGNGGGVEQGSGRAGESPLSRGDGEQRRADGRVRSEGMGLVTARAKVAWAERRAHAKGPGQGCAGEEGRAGRGWS